MLYRIISSEMEDVVAYAGVKTRVDYWGYFSEKRLLIK
jgi:hypothetical protein